jgi:hypothetical protein
MIGTRGAKFLLIVIEVVQLYRREFISNSWLLTFRNFTAMMVRAMPWAIPALSLALIFVM